MTAAGAAPVRAVFFDVGETLIDETREYGTWADWLGVPRHTFSAMFGAVIARGEDYRQVFQHFRPGFDLAEERRLRLEAGLGEYFNASDLYPDVRGCLATLKERDLLRRDRRQPDRAGRPVHPRAAPARRRHRHLRRLGRRETHARLLRQAHRQCGHGARRDRLRRGPPRQRHPPRCERWPVHRLDQTGSLGFAQADHPEGPRSHLRIDTLDDLLHALGGD